MEECDRCGDKFDPRDLHYGLCGRCEDALADHYFDTIEEAESDL